MKYKSLYNPKTAQIRGMVSAMAAAALPDGVFVLFQNWRWDRRHLKVRDGVAEITTAVSGGSFRGALYQRMNGSSVQQIAAWKDGSSVELLTGSTELTASSGPYGNTRMSDALCSMVVVRDRYQDRDLMVVSNGTDDPRIYDPQGFEADVSTTVGVHSAIEPPSDGRDITVLAKFNRFALIAGASPPTFTTSDGDVTMADTGTSPENYTLLTLASSTDTNDSAEATFSSSITAGAGNSSYAYFLVSTDSEKLWENLKIEFRLTSTSYVVIYNGSSSTAGFREVIPLAPGETDKFIVAIPLSGLAAGDVIDRMRITYVGSSSTTAAQTMKIHGIFFSGRIPGGSEAGLSLTAWGTMAMSRGQVAGNYVGEKFTRIGATSFNDARMPILGALLYTYQIKHRTLATADEVNYALAYLKQPGDLNFYYAGRDQMTEYSAGSWAFIAGATGGTNTITIGEGSLTIDRTLPMPDADHVTIPKAKYLHVSNGRLWASNVSGNPSQVWASEYRNAGMFRESVRTDAFGIFDPSSGFSLDLENEVPQGFASVPGEIPGVNSVFIFSDRTLSVVEGLDAFSLSRRRIIAQHGTLSPRTIKVYRSDVFWVDHDMQVRQLTRNGIAELSRYSIDDKLQAVPAERRDELCAEFFKDRYYIAYSTSGASTNDRMLVLNMVEYDPLAGRFGVWEADDLIPTPCTGEGLVTWIDTTNNRPRLYTFASNGKIYEYEAKGQTQDLGASIATRITTGDLTDDFWKSIFIRLIGFVIDDVASGTLAVTVTYKPHGQVGTFTTLSIDVATNQAHVICNEAISWADDSKDTTGVTAQIDIQGSLLGGKVLHSIAIIEEIGDARPNGT